MRYILGTLSVILLSLFPSVLIAQTPVQVGVQVASPYTPYLADYVSPTQSRLKIFLTLNDFNKPSLQVGLRLKINGFGLKLKTKPDYLGVPITLYPGERLELSGSDLANYLKPENLIIEGNGREQYLKYGMLPEGGYEICAEVTDFRRTDAVLSEMGCMSMYVSLLEPPVLVNTSSLGKENSEGQVEIALQSPQNMNFQWQPRHLDAPSQNMMIQYEFLLYEVPANMDARQSALSTAPIFSETVQGTSFLYGATAPNLVAGQTYAVRVQAVDLQGNGFFKNNGYSDVFTFRVLDPCLPPVNIKAESQRSESVKISWASENEIGTNYIVRYRSTEEGSEWFETESNKNSIIISDVYPDSEYEYQVKAVCEFSETEYSSLKFFKTPAPDNDKQRCGGKTEDEPITGGNPIEIKIGNIIKVNNFQMLVSSVNGSNAIGKLFVPFLGLSLDVVGEGMQVNEINGKKVMVGGKVSAKQADLSSYLDEIKIRKPFEAKMCIADSVLYDARGFDRKTGYHRDTEDFYDLEGYDIDGYNKYGFDKEGHNKNGHKYDNNGFYADGTHKDTGTKYGPDGKDRDGKKDPTTEEEKRLSEISSEEVKKMMEVNNLRKKVADIRSQLEDRYKKELDSCDNRFNYYVSKAKYYVKEENFEGTFIDNVFGENEIRIKRETILSKDAYPSRPVFSPSNRIDVDSLMKMMIGAYECEECSQKAEKLKALYKGTKLGNRTELAEEFQELFLEVAEDSLKRLKLNDEAGLELEIERFLQGKANNQLETQEEVDPTDGGNIISPFELDELYASADGLMGSSWKGLLKYPEFKGNESAQIPAIIISQKKQRELRIKEDPNKLAYALYEYVTKENKTLIKLDNLRGTDLPVGLAKEIGNAEYVITIDAAVFEPTKSSIDVYLSFEIPGRYKRLGFKGTTIPITPKGFGGGKSSRLELATDVHVRMSNFVRLIVKGTEGKTYAEFDCKGFKGFGIQGEFEFCKQLLIHADSTKAKDDNELVKARFEMRVPEWGAFAAKLDFDDFQHAKLKGYTFSIDDAYVDLSDVTNIFEPNEVPEKYQSPLLKGENRKLWKGFFLKRLRITFPSEFENKESNAAPKALFAENILIDNMGFSGLLGGENLLDIRQGKIGKWAFSLDYFEVEIVTNTLKKAEFKGKLDIPITKEGQLFDYHALIRPNNGYRFSVVSQEQIDFSVWKAKISLLPGSSIVVESENRKFLAEATLHGKASIATEQAGIPSLEFQNFQVRSKKPFVKLGTWSFSGSGSGGGANIQLAGFPVSITNILPVSRDNGNKMGLSFDVNASLMEGGVAGTVNFVVLGSTNEGPRWRYSTTQVNKIIIESSTKNIYLRGEAEIYRSHPTYGKGFKGNIEARFDIGGQGIQVACTGQFGNVKGFRYWYVDAMVGTSVGIPLAPIPISLYGFGGGAYYHMTRQSEPRRLQPETTAAKAAEIAVGRTNSGVTYVPDKATFLGVRASTIFGLSGKPEGFNGDVTFEMEFNNSGGLNRIGFLGNGYFMKEITASGSQAKVYGSVDINMDFRNKELHAVIEAYVNTPFVYGKHANKRAGTAVMHFAPKDWYIHIGTPSNRIALVFDVKVAKVNTGAYLMLGKNIPELPPLPAKVRFGKNDKGSYSHQRNPGATTGDGFCFGASLDFGVGKRPSGGGRVRFYGYFEAGIGFDVLLKKYRGVACKGRGAFGMNGWFAQGQAYAYLEGAIGASAKVFGKRRNIEVLKVAGGLALQAKLPNPSWFKGTLFGRFSLLGIIKGKFDYVVEAGEKCEFIQVGSPLDDIKVISDAAPAKNEQDVSVFAKPQVVFNMPVNKPFELTNFADNSKHTYRAKAQVALFDRRTPVRIESETWNANSDVVVLKSYSVLPGNANLSLTVEVTFEEKINGVWKKMPDTRVERLTHRFRTGERPKSIPDEVIIYSYPKANQFNFYKDEYSRRQGFIKMDYDMGYLFENPDKDWKFDVQYKPVKGTNSDILKGGLSYNYEERTVFFDIVNGLKNDEIYQIRLVKSPTKAAIQKATANVDDNVKEENKQLVNDASAKITVRTQKLTSGVKKDKKVVTYLYDKFFRTSQYSTFDEKIQAMSNSSQVSFQYLFDEFGDIIQGAREIHISFVNVEPFSKYEINEHTTSGKPLVQCVGNVDNAWYRQYIKPYVYPESYPLYGQSYLMLDRLTKPDNKIGTPPIESVGFKEGFPRLPLSTQEIREGQANNQFVNIALNYKLQYYIMNDFDELRLKCVYADVNGLLRRLTSLQRQKINSLLDGVYPKMKKGYYKVSFSYTLPNGVRTTANSTFQFYYK